MPIRNPDGTLFELRKPNPIMRKQSTWDDGKMFRLHNFQWDAVATNVAQDESAPLPPPEPIPSPVSEPSIAEIPTVEIEVPAKPLPVPPKTPPKKNPTPLKDVPRLLAHCLLSAEVETHVDDLYGEMSKRVVYGEKVSLELIVAGRTPVGVVFWTNLEASGDCRIKSGAIIYVPADREWWKVNAVQAQAGGWLLECMPSDLTPSFG